MARAESEEEELSVFLVLQMGQTLHRDVLYTKGVFYTKNDLFSSSCTYILRALCVGTRVCNLTLNLRPYINGFYFK